MSKERGFTLIELLVSAILLLIVMLGFLRGILFYIQKSLQEQTKNRAIEVLREVSSAVESYPYCADGQPCQNPFLVAYGGYAHNWSNVTCDIGQECAFESADTDNDGVRDIRDPYHGTNDNFRNNPTNFANWLNVKPAPSGTGCVGRNNNPISNLTCLETYKGRRIYVATTLARIVRHNVELGKAAGIVVWYFDPTDGRYKSYSTTVMREKR